MNPRVITDKFSYFCTDHSSNRRWVSVKGKVPVRPGTDSPIEWRKTENRYTWQQIQKIPGEYGIILDKTGLVCIDFDKCLLPSGSIESDRIDTIVRKLNSWTEISSSGTGLHTWIITDANTPNCKPGTGFEIISDGHVKVTGNSFRPTEKLPIRMVDGNELREILHIDATHPGSSGPRARHPDEQIPEGQRNNELFRIAARLRSDGMSAPGIAAALLEENRVRCTPPLPEDEVIQIAGSAGQYPPGKSTPTKPPTAAKPPTTPADAAGGSSLTELAAAERFVKQIAGECVYNISTNKWHVWNGRAWQVDERNAVKNRCRAFVKALYGDLGNVEGKNERAAYLTDIEKLNTRRGVENIVSLASIQLTHRSEDFDTNTHILNLQNGTLEFTSAGVRFREHRKEDMCSLIGGCGYHPEALIPDIWKQHVSLIASEDENLIKTMQCVLGYCLEGGNTLEKIGIATGAGRNGKSVTFRIYSRVLGGYAVNVNPLTLMENGNKTTSPERLKMRNARLILAQEPNKQTDEHRKDISTLDSGFLKAASGKDPISARGLYSNTIEEFAVTGVIFLSTNPLPAVSDRSVAFWDRIVILPFDHYFRPEDRDAKIEEKFAAVLPGILNWFVAGWEIYHKEKKIPVCEVSQIVLDEYRNADDEYAAFVADCIEEAKNTETAADDLYAEYASWSKSRYQTVKPVQLFGRDMATRFSKKRKRAGVVYCDIRIRTGQQQVSA